MAAFLLALGAGAVFALGTVLQGYGLARLLPKTAGAEVSGPAR